MINVSGSGRPKNMRIRIPNTGYLLKIRMFCGDSIVNRSLIVMCEYFVNKSANGLGGKNRVIVYREKIPQFVYS